MPNIKSAAKRVKTSEERQMRNKSVKTQVATLRKGFLEAVAKGDKEIAEKAYRAYISGVDKALKKGVIKPGNASRRKSRANAKMVSL